MSARLSSRRVVVLSSEATEVRLTVHGTGHGLGRTDRSFGGAFRAGAGLDSHRTGACPLKHPAMTEPLGTILPG